MHHRFANGDVSLAGEIERPGGARQPRPGVVICHDFPHVAGGAPSVGRSLEALGRRIAEDVGWVTFTFTFRGCGESEGNFSLAGWRSDIQAAAAELARQPDVDGVWLTGFGVGGALAACAASAGADVVGVAMLGSPADFDDWAGHPRRLREFAREVGAIRHPAFPARFEPWAVELRTIRAVGCVESLAPRPLIVIHGSDDDAVPVLDARILADAHGSAELRIIAGASHELQLDPRAVAVLIGWLDRQRSLRERSLGRGMPA